MKASEEKQQIKTGIFVLAGLALTLTAILVLGGKQSIFTPVNHYRSHFPKIDGLVSGAKVVLGGLQIGVVKTVDLDPKTRDILVRFTVETKYAEWVRQDSSVEIVTQGVLGDKYLSVVAGSPEQPKIENGGEVPQGVSKDITALFNSSEQLMLKLSQTTDQLNQLLESFNKGKRADSFFQGLSETSKNLSEISKKLNADLEEGKIKGSLKNLNQILEKINHGQGSVGALINDPTLYDDLKAMVGQVNRNRVMRNLIRQTIKDTE